MTLIAGLTYKPGMPGLRAQGFRGAHDLRKKRKKKKKLEEPGVWGALWVGIERLRGAVGYGVRQSRSQSRRGVNRERPKISICTPPPLPRS